MRLLDILTTISKRLKGITPNPHLEGQLLLCYVLKIDPIRLLTDTDREISPSLLKKINTLVNKRLKGIPVQYLVKKATFYKSDFIVSPSTLIPRPESEILIEQALKFLHDSRLKKANILEVGLGSGCIAISIIKELLLNNNCVVNYNATEISKRAFKIALKNSINLLGDLKLIIETDNQFQMSSDRICFTGFVCDILPPRFSEILARTKNSTPSKLPNFNLIISNPPYIQTGLLSKLPLEVRSEPRRALDGGANGMKMIQRIFNRTLPYLSLKAALLIEIDRNIEEKALNFARTIFPTNRNICIINDLSRKPRILKIETQ